MERPERTRSFLPLLVQVMLNLYLTDGYLQALGWLCRELYGKMLMDVGTCFVCAFH